MLVQLNNRLSKLMLVLPFFMGVVLSGLASDSLDNIVGKDLPPRSKQPICVMRDVMPGQMMDVKFRVSSEKGVNAKIYFSFDFFDVDGNNSQRTYLDVSNASKLLPPASPIPQIGEDFEIKRIVPPGAVSAKILLRSSVDKPVAKIDSFSIDVRSPSMFELIMHPNVWWRYMPWLALTVFLFAFTVGVRRLWLQESLMKHRVRGLSVVAIVAMYVAFAAWCLGDVFASDHDWVVQCFLAFALLLFILYSVLEGLGEDSLIRKHPVLFLSMMSMVVHLVVIVLCNRYFHQQMTSDASLAQQSLESGTISIGHVGRINANFHYWCNYELLLSVIGILFGPHLYVGQIVNAACCVGMFYPIYDLAREFSSKKVALFVVVLFACYPTNYFHSTLLIQDYPCSFMICWVMWFLSRMFHAGMFTRRGFLCALISGSILGMCQLIKPVSPIVLIAVLLCFLASAFGSKWRRFLNGAVIVLTVFTSFIIVSEYGQKILCYIANPYPVSNRKINGLTRTFAVGLDVKGRGANTKTLVKRYWSRAEEENTREVYESMRKDFVHYPVLVAEKIDRAFGSEMGLRRWFTVSITRRSLPEFERVVENYYYLFRILAFMGAIGFAMSFFTRKISDQILTVEMVISLFVCGFCIALMIVEAQGRYRVPTTPLSFIMIAYLPVFVRNSKDFLGRVGSCLMRGAREGRN